MNGARVKIISRAEAKARGLKRYFSGKPCPHGHVAKRRVNDCSCVECDERRVRWAQKNPERVRRHRQRYHQRHIKKRRRQSRAYQRKNAPAIRARKRRRYYSRSAEVRLAERRQRRKRRLKALREYGRRYYAANAEKMRRRARLRHRKILDLLSVLRSEMPDLVKEFGL